MAKDKPKADDIKTSTMAALMEAKKPQTVTVTVWLDPAVERQVEQATAAEANRALEARRSPDDEAAQEAHAAAVEALAEAEAAAVEARQEFVFQSIGRRRIEEMMERCRPSKDQVREFRAELTRQGQPQQPLPYDPVVFPPRLIAAAAVSPEISDEEAHEMWNSDLWSKGELTALLAGAWSVNEIV